MDESLFPEALIERLTLGLSDDYLPAFRSALSWGWPRCRTTEEKRLYPFLLIAFSPFNATVTPRKLIEGNRVSFLTSISLKAEDRPVRFQVGILCDSDAPSDADLRTMIRLPKALILTEPWKAASLASSAVMDLLFIGGSFE